MVPKACFQKTHSLFFVLFFFFPMDQRGADWSVARQNTLPDIRNFPWSPRPFKHGREACCKDIGQLSQHPQTQPCGTYGLVYVKSSQVNPGNWFSFMSGGSAPWTISLSTEACENVFCRVRLRQKAAKEYLSLMGIHPPHSALDPRFSCPDIYCWRSDKSSCCLSYFLQVWTVTELWLSCMPAQYLCVDSLQPVPASTSCYTLPFCTGIHGFAMTSSVREASLLRSVFVWWAGYWFKNNWTFLQTCLLTTNKIKNTDTTSGYETTCALDFFQTWKMYQDNTTAHTRLCHITSLSSHYWLLSEEAHKVNALQLCQETATFIFLPLSIIHTKNINVKSALNHWILISRLALRKEFTFFCQIPATDQCWRGTLY